MKKYLAVLVVLKELLEIITLPFLKIKVFILEAKLKKAEQDMQQHKRELEAEYGTSDPQELSVLLAQHQAELCELQAKLKKIEQETEQHDKELKSKGQCH